MTSDPLEMMDQLLIARLIVTAAETKFRRYPFELAESIPSEPRLMLIRRGRVEFQIDNSRILGEAGSMILMPPWIRRSWKIMKRPGYVSLSWCRFNSSGAHLHDLAYAIHRKVDDLSLEAGAIERLSLSLQSENAADGLVAEGELKSILARFLRKIALPDNPRLMNIRPLSCGEQGVQRAVQHMRTNIADANVLRSLAKVAGLHPKYFRAIFRRATGMTPGNYLIRLRMRAARYYQHDSVMRVKEVAAAVGYQDAFYFSRLYRRFWGHAPTQDRRIHQSSTSSTTNAET